MAIGVRDITNLEELLEVKDDDKIIVIQNGEAKLVSKANAKFGGGTVTVFYSDTVSSPSQPTRLVDVNGNPISAQAAYDAVMSGLVYIILTNESNKSAFISPVAFNVLKIDGGIATVVFFAMDGSFYAGVSPTGGA